MIKKLILVSLLTLSAYGDSCWSRVEMANFANDEFNEIVRFSVKDAVTCKPVANAKFILGSNSYTTDAKGIVTLPLPSQELDKEIKLKIKKDGYIDANEKVLTVFGSYWNTLFLVSKELPVNSARFVLSWGQNPDDLDLHFKGKNYHISYRKTRNIQNTVKLDRDARKGYGPETITVNNLDKNDEYRLLVSRYDEMAKINSKTQVRVYLNNRLDNIIKVPDTDAKCIELATISGNKITYKFKELNELKCD